MAPEAMVMVIIGFIKYLYMANMYIHNSVISYSQKVTP